MFRVLVVVAFLACLPSTEARRKNEATEKHAVKQHHVSASRLYHGYDVRCISQCAHDDGDVCHSPSNKWDDWCKQYCKFQNNLCVCPDDKQEECQKAADPPEKVAVEEKQQDQNKKVDDTEDDLELEEDKPKQEEKRGGCFPADATVQTPMGPKKMIELRVGDTVEAVNGAGETVFDEVYFFGHADGSLVGDYVSLNLKETTLELTGRHFLPTCPEHGVACDWAQHVQAYAQEVQAGDYIWVAEKSGMNLQMVHESSLTKKHGLFNPYTLSGKIVVNGVVASAHSDWVLDAVMPSVYRQYLPAVYQAMFLPGRVLYRLVGAKAADLLDVNNPSSQGYGAEFLAMCVTLVAAIALTKRK